MAQDITLLGAQYNDVPAVQLPKTGGGTARFDDASITTAVASDVTQGKVFLAADGTITTGTASGGGGGAVVVTEEQLSGGGIAKHITAVDISDTTAVASDVAQGKYFYTSSGVKTAGTASGGSITVNSLSVTQNGTYTAPTGTAYSPVTVTVSGGGGSVSPNQVNFIDYDGTIAYSYSRTDALALNALPSNPSHTGLTAQGWNWSLANIKSYLNKYPDAIVNVGQMYITDDGKTRIYIRLSEERKSPMIGLGVSGTVDVDWGDGSAHSTLTGNGTNTVVWTQAHNYSNGGDYVIKLTVTDGSTAAIYGSNSTNIYCRLLHHSDTADARNISYISAIKRIEIGNAMGIAGYAFYNCYSLTTVTIPSSVTSIGTTAFDGCGSLSFITIPSDVTSLSGAQFYFCYALKSVSLPNGITSFEQNMFRACYPMGTFTIPDDVTSIGNSAFYYCYSLTKITIPSGVTSIGTNVFYNCSGIKEYHIYPTTPPTLSGTNAFTGISADCIIYVPKASLSNYQTANNWSTYASYMQGE